MLHPASAHFAIVLPVVALVFSLVYLITRSEGMSKISSRLTVFAALGMIAAWYSGNQAGPEIYDYLSEHGQHELLEHKELGLYLAIALSFVAILKFIGCQMKKFAIEAIAIILLLGVTLTSFAQGKEGGEIVYEYGMPFKAYMMADTLKEAVSDSEEAEDDAERVEIYEDAIDDALSTLDLDEEESEDED